MIDVTISIHARDMLKEREIPEEWILLAINSPDHKEKNVEDNNWHYTKSIPERENRVLRVLSTRKLPLIAL